jgi:hypothetical protein
MSHCAMALKWRCFSPADKGPLETIILAQDKEETAS